MNERDPNRDIDAWLHTLDEPQPSMRLQRAVAEIPVRHPQQEGLAAWWPFGHVWKGVVAGVLVCALGVIAGASGLADSTDSATTLREDDWSESSVDLAFALPLDEELAP